MRPAAAVRVETESRDPIPVTPAAHYWMGGVRTDLWGRTSVPGLFAVGEAACTGVHGANRLASNSLLESLVYAWRCAHLLLTEPSSLEPSAGWPVAPVSGGVVGTLEAENTEAAEIVDRECLRRLMWDAAGIQRSGEGLRGVLTRLNQWSAVGTSAGDRETENLLVLARALVTAALARCESRGAHYREDYKETSAEWQRSLLYARKAVVACQI